MASVRSAEQIDASGLVSRLCSIIFVLGSDVLPFGSELVGFDFARGVGSDAWILTMWLTMWSRASFGFHDRLPNPCTNHAPKVMAINEGYWIQTLLFTISDLLFHHKF